MLREPVLPGARRQAPRRVSRKHRVAGPRQVIDQPPLLNQLLSDGASLGGAELALVVVPWDGRSDAAAEKGIGAFCEQLARTHWVRVASLGGEQDSGDIALRQGLLPRSAIKRSFASTTSGASSPALMDGTHPPPMSNPSSWYSAAINEVPLRPTPVTTIMRPSFRASGEWGRARIPNPRPRI